MSPNLIWAALQKSYYMRAEEATEAFQSVFVFLGTRGQQDAWNESHLQSWGADIYNDETELDLDSQVRCEREWTSSQMYL